ncbi:DUF58 domain-containing protein [Staphylospora marina]|uniref:DUF58 domain-containing protein n=1 Tax=Staphylospora marina TaxID=2490858 RepID=UPI000F5C0EA8|nr:DUF58 domain-containing protein [Staphylospora marina]
MNENGRNKDGSLFPDPAFLARLERLRLVVRRPVKGTQVGERRSLFSGSSQEFSDFRPYSPGDDIRRVDWTAYARFRKWFLKIYVDERETDVHLWLDISRSMSWDAEHKARRALELAGALGYLALGAGDRLRVHAFARRVEAVSPPFSGKKSAPRLFSFLSSLSFDKDGDPDGAEDDAGYLLRRRGISIIISDGFTPSGGRSLADSLRRNGQEVHMILLFSGEEREPSLSGDLRLIDCETGDRREITVNSHVLRLYRETFRHHVEELSDWCRRRGIVLLPVSAEMTLEETVLDLFRRSGMVERQRG